jgi:6-phosphogluconate dehydrogenase
MVHNGIEYGDMQLIAEGYFILKHLLGLTNQEMHQVFRTWNTGVLDSYLIEITAEILVKLDDGEDGAHDGGFIVDRILDKAGQKGTGKWTAVAALDAGMPLTLIGEAVFARCLSAQKAERVRAAQKLQGAAPAPVVFGEGEKAALIDAVRDALYAAKIVSYAQGFVLLRAAAQELGWKSLNYAAIAGMWRGGCIIRSKFLNNITEAFERDPELENLLLDGFFVEQVHQALPGWRRIASQAILNGIAIPAISSALSYFDGYR